MVKLIAIVAFLAAVLICSQEVWSDVDTIQKFNSIITSRKPTIAFIFDTRNCPLCKYLVQEKIAMMPNDDKMKNFRCSWIYVDIAKMPDLKETLKVTNRMHVRYYKQSRYVEMPEALELVKRVNTSQFNYENTVNKIFNFIKGILDSYSKHVTSIEEIKDWLGTKDSAIIYTGAKNTNFMQYFEFASSYPSDKMFHTFDEKIIREVRSFADVLEDASGDILVIIRAPNVQVYDKERNAIYYSFPLGENKLIRISLLDCYPKVRDPTLNEVNIKSIEQARIPMILHSKSDPYSLVNSMHFKRIVKALPKSFIFSFSSPKHPEHSHYVKLFEQVGMPLEEETLYLVYKLGYSKIKVKKFDENIKTENFIEFLLDFAEKEQDFAKVTAEINIIQVLRDTLNKLKNPGSQMDEL